MPRKVRQLKSDLRRGGCLWRPARGSHTVWTHELVPEESVTLAGNDGDDAQPYQERDVRRLLRLIQKAREQQQ